MALQADFLEQCWPITGARALSAPLLFESPVETGSRASTFFLKTQTFSIGPQGLKPGLGGTGVSSAVCHWEPSDHNEPSPEWLQSPFPAGIFPSRDSVDLVPHLCSGSLGTTFQTETPLTTPSHQPFTHSDSICFYMPNPPFVISHSKAEDLAYT